MTKVERVIFSILAIMSVFAFIFWKDFAAATNSKTKIADIKDVDKNSKKVQKDSKKKNKKDEEEKTENTHPDIKIIQKWDLPANLKEISGIAFIKENQFACVQDELGKIFVFNTESGKVEEEIQFADAGDYEGIAVVNETAYIVRADGLLFEVNNFFSGKPSLIQHNTHLTGKHDVEGLCYDKKNNRLLLSIKGNELKNENYKGIYAFDLSLKKIATVPVHKIDLTDKIWDKVKGKNKIQPSDLDVHPLTRDIYIVDGANPKLLVMGADGIKKNLYHLSSSDFEQPEGITFTDNGELYISNEGKDRTGNILKISIGKLP